jgi:hypothetical protein
MIGFIVIFFTPPEYKTETFALALTCSVNYSFFFRLKIERGLKADTIM